MRQPSLGRTEWIEEDMAPKEEKKFAKKGKK